MNRTTYQLLLPTPCAFESFDDADDVLRSDPVPAPCPPCCIKITTGTHVSNTAEVGAFKVLSESGVASGVRRIEAVAGLAAAEHLAALDGVVRSVAGSLRVKPEDVPARVAALQVRAEIVCSCCMQVCCVLFSLLTTQPLSIGMQDDLKSAMKQLAEPSAQLVIAKAAVRFF